MQPHQHAQLGQAAQAALRLGLGQDQLQLVTDALGTDALQQVQAAADEFLGARLDVKLEALFEPRRAQDARGVFDEAQAVQHPDDALIQVAAAAIGIQQLAPPVGREPNRQGVDGEVTAMQVLLDAGTFDRRQGRRMLVEFGAGRDEIKRLRQVAFRLLALCLLAGLRQNPLGRAEAPMAAHAAARALGQQLRQTNCIALHDQIDIEVGLAQEQVTHEAADHIKGVAQITGHSADLVQQVQQRRGQRARHRIGQRFRPNTDRSTLPDEIGPRHDAEQRARLRIEHGNLAPVVIGHDLAQRRHGILRRHVNLACAHVAPDAMPFQPMMDGPVDLPPRQHADDARTFDHRKALKPVAPPAFCRSRNGVGRRERLRRTIGHDLAHGDAGTDVALQCVNQ